MDAHERRPASRVAGKLATNQRDVQLVVRVARIRDHAEISMPRGQNRFRNAPNVALVLHAVADQVGDGQQLHSVQAAKFQQLRRARHGAVIVHDFADHAGMIEAGDPRQIHGCFGLSRAHEHAAVPRAQCVHVPGPRQIFGTRVRIRGGQNRGGAVGRARSRGGSAPGVDGLAKRGAEGRGVSRRNRRQVQRVAALLRQRQANQPAPEFRHEVDGFRRHFLRRHRQVAFILAVFVVHQDDHASGANVFQRLFHRRKWHFVRGHFRLLAVALFRAHLVV